MGEDICPIPICQIITLRQRLSTGILSYNSMSPKSPRELQVSSDDAQTPEVDFRTLEVVTLIIRESYG